MLVAVVYASHMQGHEQEDKVEDFSTRICVAINVVTLVTSTETVPIWMTVKVTILEAQEETPEGIVIGTIIQIVTTGGGVNVPPEDMTTMTDIEGVGEEDTDIKLYKWFILCVSN
uniref:Uncharacterized protein n=1 Tax=Photinus pyralis TaxID=7054 RepID=A0A1Y1MNN1_PHOPY